jgi:hypothetical protein
MGRVPKFVRADGGGSSMRFLGKRPVSTRAIRRESRRIAWFLYILFGKNSYLKIPFHLSSPRCSL